MTCKDCFHEEMCHMESCYLDYRFEHRDNIETYCEEFKNKDDVVEVVRCKDCKKRGTFDCVKSKGNHPITAKNNEFCCWGERKDT